MADGHAAERRYGKRAAESCRTEGGRGVGPGRGRAGGHLCKAFGPPGLIRQPGRIRIRWENDNTLVMEFDAGTQTRRFHFGRTGPAARDRCRGTPRRGGSGSLRTAGSSDAEARRAAARSKS